MAGALGGEEARELEDMIDRSSVGDVLEALADICYEKADHIEEAWQDEGAARDWSRAADALDKLAAKLHV